MTTVAVPARWIRFARWSIKCTRLRCSLVLFCVLLLVTVMFSSWNVCNSDYDDDVDAQIADATDRLSSGRSRRSAKTCLSPLTDAGVRVNISLDSHSDLERYNVSAHAAKPYTSIIHVIWTTSEVPKRWRRSAKSCLSKNEKFAYCHWTHTELEAFVADEYPWLLSTYLAYPYIIQRCAVARYLVLYNYGGTYVDLDIVCRVNMSVVFVDAPVDAGCIVAPTEPFGVTNEFIAVRRPRDPVIRDVISGLRRAAASPWYPPLPYTTVMFRTGVVYFTRRLNCDGGEGRLFIMPSSKYYDIYVSHVGGASWHEWDGRLIWKLFLIRRQLYKYAIVLAVSASVFMLLVRVIRTRNSIVN